jgi:hypothetical protein
MKRNTSTSVPAAHAEQHATAGQLRRAVGHVRYDCSVGRITSMVTPAPPTRSRQLLQQRLGCLQVDRVKAFGEPAIDVGQQLATFYAPGLPLPQPAEAYSRP